WPFASLRGTQPEAARAIAIALLSMNHGRDGMSWTVPDDYQSVHEVFRKLEMGPYEYLRKPTLEGVIREYWWAGLSALLALFAWGAYTLRNVYLVRTRSAALRQAQQEARVAEIHMRTHQEQVDHLSRLSVLGELSSTLAHELS